MCTAGSRTSDRGVAIRMTPSGAGMATEKRVKPSAELRPVVVPVSPRSAARTSGRSASDGIESSRDAGRYESPTTRPRASSKVTRSTAARPSSSARESLNDRPAAADRARSAFCSSCARASRSRSSGSLVAAYQ